MLMPVFIRDASFTAVAFAIAAAAIVTAATITATAVVTAIAIATICYLHFYHDSLCHLYTCTDSQFISVLIFN